MATVLPVGKKIAKKIIKKNNPAHPGLNLELLEPKTMGIYSIRINRKFRALLFFRDKQTIEILNITVHYR